MGGHSWIISEDLCPSMGTVNSWHSELRSFAREYSWMCLLGPKTVIHDHFQFLERSFWNFKEHSNSEMSYSTFAEVWIPAPASHRKHPPPPATTSIHSSQMSSLPLYSLVHPLGLLKRRANLGKCFISLILFIISSTVRCSQTRWDIVFDH